MRFNRRNWDKFFDGSNKQTTIRLKKSKIGHHKAYAGSYYNPVILGEFDIVKIDERNWNILTEQDGVDDGFSGVIELRNELKKINGIIEGNTKLYKHWIENAVKL